mgnify:CR=1 FL=1
MNRTLTSALTATLVMLLGLSAPAYAVTPAGTLSITVTVTHAESGTEPLTSSTGFTVGLVPAAPKLSAPVNQKVTVAEQNAEGGIVTYEYNITTIINTHDMNSVMEIGEKIIFLKNGLKEWEGTNKEIFKTDNQAVTDFVYSSELFKKVRQMYIEERN